jgi:hypothetical protein
MRLLTVAACLIIPITGFPAAKEHKLDPASAERWKNGKSVVYFSDDVGQIGYTKDNYFVLGVSRQGTEGAYNGLWDSNRQLSAINAEELSKLGIDATSLFDMPGGSELQPLVAAQAPQYAITQEPSSPRPELSVNGGVSEDLRTALLAQGRHFLVWVNWNGFKLRVLTLGLRPFEEMTVGYRIVDLDSNQSLANVTVLFMERVDMQGATAKDFLERNGLQRLKADVETLMRARFTSTKLGTVGLAPRRTMPQLIGFSVTR